MSKYILSKMTNNVSYRLYRMVGEVSREQKTGPLPVPLPDAVIIRGGADRPTQRGGIGEMSEDINGNVLWTPRGVVTKVTDEQYAQLKDHWLFKKHLDGGFLAVLDKDISSDHKAIKNVTDDMEGQDRAAQLTKSTIAQRIKVKVPSKELNQDWN